MKEESRIVRSLLRISWVFALVLCGTGVVSVNAQQARPPDASVLGSNEESKWNTVGLRWKSITTRDSCYTIRTNRNLEMTKTTHL